LIVRIIPTERNALAGNAGCTKANTGSRHHAPSRIFGHVETANAGLSVFNTQQQKELFFPL
jgi:hypothetical protein